MGQFEAPAWELKHEGLPALRAPAVGDPAALEDEMLAADGNRTFNRYHCPHRGA